MREPELALSLPDRRVHEQRAAKWRDKDIIDRKQAMADYVESVMPGLTLVGLVEARAEVRARGARMGITIGG